MGCKGKEIEAQRQQGREFAKCKDFDKLLGANRAQAQALRIGFKQAAKLGEVHELLQELQLQGRAVSGRVHGLPLLRVARDHGDGA